MVGFIWNINSTSISSRFPLIRPNKTLVKMKVDIKSRSHSYHQGIGSLEQLSDQTLVFSKGPYCSNQSIISPFLIIFFALLFWSCKKMIAKDFSSLFFFFSIIINKTLLDIILIWSYFLCIKFCSITIFIAQIEEI